MRWQFGRRSDNVEDRRGRGGAGPVLVGGGGIGAVILAVVVLLLGGDPSVILQGTPTGQGPSSAPTQTSPEQDELAEFVSVVLADTEDTWNTKFQQIGRDYQEPNLVLFSNAVESACGYAQAAVGPFYCPADEKVYIDLNFFQAMQSQLGAPGDFAQAYVVAHEVAHHVQNQLGISDQVRQAQQRVSRTEANQLSVRLELQADCLAGIWANTTSQSENVELERGDIQEGLNAASAIGDDRLQRKSQGYVVPDAFTHGSSEQRVRWFTKGLETGDVAQCDTFATPQL
ncbi:MAG: neutral zinc metallopeptidase [Elainellaceae cyanobacterium]